LSAKSATYGDSVGYTIDLTGATGIGTATVRDDLNNVLFTQGGINPSVVSSIPSSTTRLSAGTRTLTVTFTGDNTSDSQSIAVAPKALTVSATAGNKVYDGTTTASVTLSDDRLSGDSFTPTYTSATFSDKDVANSKTVTV